MPLTEFLRVDCPYCGEAIDLVADASGGGQQYIEDCPVCCQPMRVSLAVDADGDCSLSVSREDEV